MLALLVKARIRARKVAMEWNKLSAFNTGLRLATSKAVKFRACVRPQQKTTQKELARPSYSDGQLYQICAKESPITSAMDEEYDAEANLLRISSHVSCIEFHAF